MDGNRSEEDDAGGDALDDLLRRVRRGDEEAARELVREYEPEIRREVRARLRDRRLRVVMDSADVVQSVFASFFVRMSLGLFRIESSGDLVGLLSQLARNKVVDASRRTFAGKRDGRRTQHPGPDVMSESLADTVAAPDEAMELGELVQAFRGRLSEEERTIVDLRSQGADWHGVADALGGTPDARRVQLQRAAARVASELGLES